MGLQAAKFRQEDISLWCCSGKTVKSWGYAKCVYLYECMQQMREYLTCLLYRPCTSHHTLQTESHPSACPETQKALRNALSKTVKVPSGQCWYSMLIHSINITLIRWHLTCPHLALLFSLLCMHPDGFIFICRGETEDNITSSPNTFLAIKFNIMSDGVFPVPEVTSEFTDRNSGSF